MSKLSFKIQLSTLMLGILSCSLGLDNTTTNGRWENPCGGNIVNVSIAAEPVIPHIEYSVSIERMIVKIREAQTAVESVQNKYAIERIGNIKLIQNLQNYHLDNFPSTKISPEEMNEKMINVTETHLKVFLDLSVVAVFMESVSKDEVLYEYSAYSPDIQENNHKLYSTMCELQFLIRNLGSSVEKHVLRDVMKEEYRSLTDKSERHMRDYIIVKDMAVFYDTLNELYAEMRTRLP